MKVYFGTSPRIKEGSPELVNKVYDLVVKWGHKHTSPWVRNVVGNDFYKMTDDELDEHHRKTTAAIKSAEVCIFEVSSHSLSVGYLVNFALENGKVVILLTQNKSLPTIFRTIQSDKLITVVYDATSVEKSLREALEKAREVSDVRFNFFVSPKILSYLDWVAKHRMIPRSVFLRDLIEREMRKDKGFRE